MVHYISTEQLNNLKVCESHIQHIMKLWGQDPNTSPHTLLHNHDLVKLRLSLIDEEYTEMLDGIENNDPIEALDGAVDLLYVTVGACVAFNIKVEDVLNTSNIENTELIHNIKCRMIEAYSSMEKYSICPMASFFEVHTSNMTKFCQTDDEYNESVEKLAEKNGNTTSDYFSVKINDKIIIKRASDGKILKGVGFRNPDLTNTVKRG